MKPADKQKGYLIDTTKCIGCKACTNACKIYNNNPADKGVSSGKFQSPNMTSETFTVVKLNEVMNKNNQLMHVFVKDQCKHCLEPACESACIVGALHKTDDGPVVWDTNKCIGCRYCMMACPFGVPKFQWNKTVPDIRKCTLCSEKIKDGSSTACAEACPTGAILFGERGELLKVGHSRLKASPNKYHQHIYGEREVGGTNVLYISNVPLEDLDYPKNLSDKPIGDKTAPAMQAIPGVVMGLGVVLGSISWVYNRKLEIKKLEKKEP